MTTIRAFVALPMPEAAQEWLMEAQRAIKRAAPSGVVRWSDLRNSHLTMKFLGEVDERLVPQLREAVDASSEVTGGFSMTLRGAGCFPPAGAPRVLWAGMEAGHALTDLYEWWEARCLALGFPRERRAFSPHLTLGRTRDSLSASDSPRLREAAAACSSMPPLSFQAECVCLYRSVLLPRGPEYTVLRRAVLIPRGRESRSPS